MNVILRENVSNLGKIGDIVSVSHGYWRNYLLPRKLALLANSRNVNQLEHNKQVTQARLTKARAAAETVGEKLAKVSLSIAKRCGGDGRLFGSVTPRELVDLLSDQGIALDRRDLSLSEPIKTLGDYEISARLHRDVSVSFKVSVTSAGGETPEVLEEEIVSDSAEDVTEPIEAVEVAEA